MVNPKPRPNLRLEYHDLLSLFEFLDNGDGQITSLGLIIAHSYRGYQQGNIYKFSKQGHTPNPKPEGVILAS